MLTPQLLQKGDTIAIAASARKISAAELQPAIDIFTSWGLNVHLPYGLFETDNQFAGSDQHRASILQMLLDDTEIKAIVFARGGYGTVRIIEELDFKAFNLSPKWLVGYSDITILHSHVQQNFGIETMHATMPINFNYADVNSKQSIDTLKSVLFGEIPSYRFQSHILNRQGQAKGVITGGNLSILYSLLGSKTDCDTAGKILFIEDIDEYLYHIDRMMLSLKRAGKLDNLAGLLVGGFADMKDNEIPFGKTAEEIIAEAVKDFAYPVFFNFPAGHQPVNLPLIMGREVVITSDDMSTLTFNTPQPGRGFKAFLKIIKPAVFIIGGFIVLYILYSVLLGKL